MQPAIEVVWSNSNTKHAKQGRPTGRLQCRDHFDHSSPRLRLPGQVGRHHETDSSPLRSPHTWKKTAPPLLFFLVDIFVFVTKPNRTTLFCHCVAHDKKQMKYYYQSLVARRKQNLQTSFVALCMQAIYVAANCISPNAIHYVTNYKVNWLQRQVCTHEFNW